MPDWRRMGVVKQDRPEGIYPILVTPLTREGEVDEPGLCHLVEFCCDRGFEGLVVLGSNGEFPYLSVEEKRTVMRTAARQARGRVDVVAGISAPSTDLSLSLAREARDAGCDRALAALPSYFDLAFEHIRSHYEALCQAAEMPIVLYHFPDTTRLRMTPEQIAELARLEGIWGAKLTTFNRAYLTEIIEKTRDLDFAPFVGITFLLSDCLEAGGAGCFCPIPLLRPTESKAIQEAHRSGDVALARRLQDRLTGALPLIIGGYMEPKNAAAKFNDIKRQPLSLAETPPPQSHAFIKEALRLQGHPITNMVKRPYRPVSGPESEQIAQTLRGLDWL